MFAGLRSGVTSSLATQSGRLKAYRPQHVGRPEPDGQQARDIFRLDIEALRQAH